MGTALLVLGGAATFIALARGQRAAHVERWRAQLQAMADDRRSAVDRWLAEGVGDARTVASYPTAVQLASHAAGGSPSQQPDVEAREHLTAVLRSQVAMGGYRAVLLLGREGQVLAAGGKTVSLDAGCLELVRRSTVEHRPMVDLHRHADEELVVRLTAPILAGSGRPVGAALLTADPEQWLFPFLRHQPVPSDTAETALVQRDAGSALFLSPLRHSAAPPLTLRRPLDSPGFAAAAAIQGRDVFIEAVDYRGAPVLAVTRHLETAPWGMVTKVDREEALRGYRRWRAGAAATLAALALAFVSVAYAAWERRRLQDLAEVEESERRYRLLAENVSDVVWVLDLDSGRFLYVSPSVERLCGFSVEEALAQGLEVTLTPESLKHLRQVIPARLERFRSGTVESFVDHVEQRRKDGSTVWVEATSRAVLEAETGRVKVYGCSRDITDRKRAESALQDSEEQLRAVFELASIGLAQADPRTGRWLRVNQRLCAITGYPEAEMLRLRIPEITHPDDRDRDWEAFQRVVRGEAPDYRLEKRYLRKDGADAWVNVNMTVVRDAAWIPVRTIAAVEDITERKQVEQEREVTVRLLRVLNSSADLHDLIRGTTRLLQEWLGCDAVGIRLQRGDDFPYFETRGFSAEFVAAESSLCVRNAAGDPVKDDSGNPVLECMCGNVLRGRVDPAQPFFTPRGSFWTNCTTALLASTTEADRQSRTRNRCNGEGYESVALVALRVGEETHGLVQINDRRQGRLPPDRMALLERLADNLAVAIAHRQGQQDLSESEQRYRFLFTNMLEGYALCVMTYDHGVPQDFVFLDVNNAFERLTGLHDVVGKAVSEVIPGLRDSNPELFEVYGRVALTGEPEHLEAFVEPLGIWFSISVYSPEREHFVAVFNDVTERKQAEAAVLALNADLEQRVRERTAELEHSTTMLEAANRELEAFSYSVSHDLRAPLRAIDGFARILADDYASRLDAEAQRLIGVVRNSTRQMGQLIDDLLSFSRMSRAEMRICRVGMEGLVRVVFQELVAHHESPAELVLDRLPDAVGDPAMLRQVWVNLVSNAVKFTAPRGREGRVEVCARRQGHERVYEVRDNGVGFDMRYADRLFGVFQRLHRQDEFPGTGVGLALVQRIVHRHGGRIWATAAPDEGATFYFTLGGRDGDDEAG